MPDGEADESHLREALKTDGVVRNLLVSDIKMSACEFRL